MSLLISEGKESETKGSSFLLEVEVPRPELASVRLLIFIQAMVIVCFLG